VSEVRIEEHELGGQASDTAELLALPGMRRSLESEPSSEAARLVGAMTPVPPIPQRDLKATMLQLVELIEAIDRRLPQVQRAGEGAIANAATRLRIEATKRIAEIELELASRESVTTARPAVAP
jgi:hypothetical protein